jgi:hypothetical protein
MRIAHGRNQSQCPDGPFSCLAMFCYNVVERKGGQGIHWAAEGGGPASAGSRMMYETPYATVHKDPINQKEIPKTMPSTEMSCNLFSCPL